MAKLLVDDTSLTSVADAIRTKGGTGEQLVFPEGFNNAIANIPSGGGDIGEYFDLKPQPDTEIRNLIKDLPLIDTSNYTDMNYFFSGHASLQSVPLLDTSNVTNMAGMFSSCSKLLTIPLIDTSSAINMNYMFHQCYALQSIPLLDTSSVTSMVGMFSNCHSIKDIPTLNTSKVTDMSSMFVQCRSLTVVPKLDTSSLINAETMFAYSNITTVPLLDFSKVNNISGIFNNDSNITNLGGFKDLGKAYLTSASENNRNYTLSLGSTNLTHDSLMNVINNLYDIKTAGVQPQKLELGYGNIDKLTAEEKAIATNKGWNVVL